MFSLHTFGAQLPVSNSTLLNPNYMHKLMRDACYKSECGDYLGIFCGILSVPHNIVMNLNNVMELARNAIMTIS